MKKNMTISSILFFLQLSFWIPSMIHAADSKPNLQFSIQRAILSGGGGHQFGFSYSIVPEWSVGVFGITDSYKDDSKYGVETVKGYGSGLTAVYYRSGYSLDGFLSKGRIGLQALNLSQKGFKVHGNDRLGLRQLDVDILGGYQFVWNQEFVLDFTAGLRKSFLDVSHKEYVFNDELYNLKVFRAEDVESPHLLVEFGLGMLI
ncbi:MAG: hypothetical protein AB8G05_23955 [Oligoflexales bacterium]